MDESVPVPAATGNGNQAVADEATCHLCFDGDAGGAGGASADPGSAS